jgi:hypothetical protein
MSTLPKLKPLTIVSNISNVEAVYKQDLQHFTLYELHHLAAQFLRWPDSRLLDEIVWVLHPEDGSEGRSCVCCLW